MVCEGAAPCASSLFLRGKRWRVFFIVFSRNRRRSAASRCAEKNSERNSMNVRRRSEAILFVCLVAWAFLSAVPAAFSQSAAPPILLGTAWYPEQWPESRWEADLQLMQEAGIHIVRVGEFAWSRMEPSEGRYDLDWLDRAVT